MASSRLRLAGRPSLCLIAGAALALCACDRMGGGKSEAAPKRAEDPSQTLAKIDDVVISVADFQTRINQQSPYVRARYTSLERKREFLDNLVRFEVLAKEAERRGYQNDDEVQRTMKQVMIQRLMKEEFDTSVKLEDITDDECRKYFEAHGDEFNKPEEIRVADIVVKDAATGKKVLSDPRIKGVEPAGFRELVAQYSTDAATKDRGGDLRYFDAKSKELPPEIVKAGFALVNIGDVSEPVKGASGLHILKLTGRRKALVRPFDEVKAQIKNRLFRDKRTTAMEDFVKKLREKSKVEVHEDRLAKVQVEGGTGGAPGLQAPGAQNFHPGAPGAPQASPASPGVPPGMHVLTPPSGAPAVPAAQPVQ